MICRAEIDHCEAATEQAAEADLEQVEGVTFQEPGLFHQTSLSHHLSWLPPCGQYDEQEYPEPSQSQNGIIDTEKCC
jgi:hypothetical protein